MKLFTSLSLLMLMALGSCTLTLRQEKVEVAPSPMGLKVVSADKDFSGLQYALPNTGLRFYVRAEKLEKKRGEFYLYSERYLGVKDVVLEDAVEWKIKDVKLETFGVASKDVYGITSASVFIPMLNLLPDGVLASLNVEVADQVLKREVVAQPQSDVMAVPYTEEMLLANSTAKMAQEAARYIYRLRENRTALLSSELEVLPPDGDAYDKSLSGLDALEEKFVNLFVGEVNKTTVTKVVEILPENLIEKDVLFRFSSFRGVVDKDDLSGSPVYISMRSGQVFSQTELPDTAALFYRRPALVDVTLLDGLNKVLQEKVAIGQLGQISAFPIGALDEEVAIELYPKTGAIKSITKRQ